MRPGLTLSGNLLLEMRRGRTVRPWKLSAPSEDPDALAPCTTVLFKGTALPCMISMTALTGQTRPASLFRRSLFRREEAGGGFLPSFSSLRGSQTSTCKLRASITLGPHPQRRHRRLGVEEGGESGYKTVCTVDPVRAGEADE